MEKEALQDLAEAKKIRNSFAEAILALDDSEDFPAVVDEIIDCKGKIITTGMGKAGIIMKEFASILCSVGFPAAF